MRSFSDAAGLGRHYNYSPLLPGGSLTGLLNPCFLQIVPEAVRTSVYAFDKCIIGAIGALSTPLAGVLAEKVFGFTHVSTKGEPALG
jgi:hypothetical protein